MAHEKLKAGVKHFVYGLIYGFILYFIYVMFFPMLFSRMGLPSIPISFKGVFMGFLLFFITVESFASAFRGTVYGFVLKAISKLFGLLIFIYIIGNGVLSGHVEISGSTVYFSLNIEPIIAGVVLLTFPFIILDVIQITREAKI